LYGIANWSSLEITKPHTPFFGRIAGKLQAQLRAGSCIREIPAMAESICLHSAENNDKNFI